MLLSLFLDLLSFFDWNVDPAGTQFNDYRGSLVRINGRWRIKELIATPTKVIV